jgi:hypothetical protein
MLKVNDEEVAYRILSVRYPRAAKNYQCHLCLGTIRKGYPHRKVAILRNGNFDSYRAHFAAECEH